MSAARYSWYASGGGFEGGIGTNKLEVRPSMPQSSPTRRCSRYRRNRRCGTDRTANRIARSIIPLTLDRASATKNIRTGTNVQQPTRRSRRPRGAGAPGDGESGHLNISRPRAAKCAGWPVYSSKGRGRQLGLTSRRSSARPSRPRSWRGPRRRLFSRMAAPRVGSTLPLRIRKASSSTAVMALYSAS